MSDREILETDVLIVGGGAAGLSCAISVVSKVKQYNRLHPAQQIELPNILLLEKAASVGAHILSGAVFDPRGLDELIPDWFNRGAPIKQKVTEEEVALLTPTGKIPVPSPALPPYLHNHGNYIVSLSDVVAWMGTQAQEMGIEILEGVGGARLLYDGQKVRGVVCGDAGLDEKGEPGPDHMPGAEIHAKVTVLAEGVRGSLTKELIHRLGLDVNRNPQTYATGVKELWEIPAGTFPAGKVVHTLGFPLQHPPHQILKPDAFGGSFIYGLDETHLVIGLVVGLDYKDPFLDPHNEFNRLKNHPKIRPLLENGKMISYGAKAIPEGGYYSMPRFFGDGFLIVGDSASFLNAARLKGAHLAIKSGILAGEALTQAFVKSDFSEKQLGHMEDLFQTSWAKDELYAVRNWRAAFAKGVQIGALHDLAQRVTKGRGLVDPMPVEDDFEATNHYTNYHPEGSKPQMLKPDGKVTFDKMTDVYHSGTVHGETQPSHLVVPEPDICVFRCTREYGNPCQYFCPAGVYEWVLPGESKEFGARYGEESKGELQINFGNCVHCKTCDIKDPYENITWVVPEGGDGPRYQRL